MFKIRFLIFILVIFMFSSFGCESFRKKFIRKPKGKPKEEEMVIVPKDYSKLQLPIDEAYIQYYTYWKAWHNELLTFLVEGQNKKKIISCFEQAILNLNRMKDLLENEEKISLLDGYVGETSSLAEEIKNKTLAMITTGRIKNQSEQLLRNIQRDFSFSKIKDDLKW
ncbi:MAG: hypothetical protein ISS47_07115 [Candidatus Omnitrophica bacterium]|nr:hypothetical protein [Candidatus Omnitrophota bacterium]